MRFVCSGQTKDRSSVIYYSPEKLVLPPEGRPSEINRTLLSNNLISWAKIKKVICENTGQWWEMLRFPPHWAQRLFVEKTSQPRIHVFALADEGGGRARGQSNHILSFTYGISETYEWRHRYYIHILYCLWYKSKTHPDACWSYTQSAADSALIHRMGRPLVGRPSKP